MTLTPAELAEAMATALKNSGLQQSINNLTSATTSLESKIVSSAAGATSSTSTTTNDVVGNSEKVAANTQATSEAADAAAVSVKETGAALESAASSGSKLTDIIFKAGDIAAQTAVKITSFASKLNKMAREQTDLIVTLDNTVQEAFGNVRFAEFGSSAIAKSVQGVFEDALRETTDLSKELRNTSNSTTVDILGSSQSALQFLFGAGEDGINEVKQAIGDFYNSSRAESEKFFAQLSKDEIKRSVSIGKALGLAADTQADLVQKSIDRTGKASTDLIEEIGAYSVKIQQVTGASSKTIASGIASLITDVETFGDIGVDSAARISGALANLGVQMESFSGLVSKFMNFDTAVSSIGDLTSAFGLQLDAMEMFRLANEDEEEFLKRIRQEFQSQGLAVEDLNKAQLNLLKSTLGFSDVGDVQNFLREGSAGFEEMAEATEDVDVASSFEEIVAQGKPATVAIEQFNEALTANTMLNAAEDARVLALRLDDVTLAGGKLLEGTTRTLRETTQRVGLETTSFLVDEAGNLLKGDIEQIASDFESVFKGIETRAGKLIEKSVSAVTTGITDSELIKNFKAQFSFENLMPDFLRPGSLSPFGRKILDGIVDQELEEEIAAALDSAFNVGYNKVIQSYDEQFVPALMNKFRSFEEMIGSQVLEPNSEFLNNLVDNSLQSSAQTVTTALQNAQSDIIKEAIESIDLGVETTGESITATAVPITDAIGQLKDSADANLDMQKQIVNNGNQLLTAMSQLIEGVSGLKESLEMPSNIENKTVLNLDGRVVAEIVNNNSYNPNTGQTVLVTNEHDLQ
jgi:hypothetical protein